MARGIFYKSTQYGGGLGAKVAGMTYDDYENLSEQAKLDGSVRFLQSAPPVTTNYYYDEETSTVFFNVDYAQYDSETETVYLGGE